MAVNAPADIRVRGLGRQKLSALAAKAKRLGLTPEAYVKRLVMEDLEVSQTARSTTFEKLMGQGREVDEAELDRLVDLAKAEHHARRTKKTK